MRNEQPKGRQKGGKPAGMQASFRVGRVRGDLRGRVWYLTYHEQGRRRRPRVGPDAGEAKRLAAQINAQLASGVPAALSFEPLSIPELRDRWLSHHEHVLRSSVHTVARYRTATDHLLRFLAEVRQVRSAADFRASHAEEFVCYLRAAEVAPNGHPNSAKRRLLDSGVKYVLETCRALFNYAAKRRHMPPYAENPFAALEVDRIPVEDAKPVELFTPEQERAFFEACDGWQLPLFLTLALTGLRPGELTQLLLPDDLDLERGVLRVRNKPALGWQVKTRSEREVPLVPVLTEVLRRAVGGRTDGPAFLRRRADADAAAEWTARRMEREVAARLAAREAAAGGLPPCADRLRDARRVWRQAGVLKEDRVRAEFIRVAWRAGLPRLTAPKLLRHQFATALQEANVDPLVRNELMGHSHAGRTPGAGLGMTARYTHTRPETVRRRLTAALEGRPCAAASIFLRTPPPT
jgi:integrase